MKKFRFQFESVLKMRRHKRSLCRQLLGEILQADQRLVEESQRLDTLRLEQIQETEESNWWVERIEEPEPAMEQLETEPQGEDETELPLGINR